MRTVKLVGVGASGVGKTSLRNQVRRLTSVLRELQVFTRLYRPEVHIWTIYHWLPRHHWCRFYNEDCCPLPRSRGHYYFADMGELLARFV